MLFYIVKGVDNIIDLELEKKYEQPSDFAEYIGLEYAHLTTNQHKKEHGQFFTPKEISDFMGSLARPTSDKISILDPGCGMGILSCSLIEKLILKCDLRVIDLVLYETDKEIIIETQKVIDYLKYWLNTRGVEFNYSINHDDFILENAEAFSIPSLFGGKSLTEYDYIISNPPYFKISKSDKRAVIAKELVYGQPNIYSIFMGMSAKLLKPHGELIFITPRSFASGNYFRAFRESFFNNVSISDIHIFESRSKMFKHNNVLQENIILRATKEQNLQIKISVSECNKGLDNPSVSVFNTEVLLDLTSENKILFIPSNKEEANTIDIFKKWENSINTYNIQISTGPVVAFRCTEYLKIEGVINDLISPLIWLHNIKEMKFVYPLQKGRKPGFIINSYKSKKVLLKNKNYILLRRFSSKDDKSRLICCPYFSSNFNTEMIGIENHINYIHRPNGSLSEDEIWGISALFSSSLFDTYFRTFNGNTQVGASELKQIKMPPLNDIILIGNRVKLCEKLEKQNIDQIIKDILLEKIC